VTDITVNRDVHHDSKCRGYTASSPIACLRYRGLVQNLNSRETRLSDVGNLPLDIEGHFPTIGLLRWDEKVGLRRDAIRSQSSTRSRRKERRPAVDKGSTVTVSVNHILKRKKLTIGMDLGDRSTRYCV
jgi:hypothetical protein